MTQADKGSYPEKTKRHPAPHEEGHHERRELIIKRAAERAWVAVNKHDAGWKRHTHRHAT